MSQQNTDRVRSLMPEDIDAVVDIDARITGRSRRVFYEKRLETALETPNSFITAACVDKGKVSGFAFARVQNGEFGNDYKAAVLDVICVDPDQQHHGQGSQMLESICAIATKIGINELRTEIDWNDADMVRFFSAQDFSLAPYQALSKHL